MKKLVLLIPLVLILISVVFVSGCAEEEELNETEIILQNAPQISLTVQPKIISLENNETTSGFVTATLVREDERDFSAVIEVRVRSTSPGHIYPVDADGEPKMYFETSSLKGQNSQDIVQFKVFGDKAGFESVSGTLTVEMYWNATKLPQTEAISVSIN